MTTSIDRMPWLPKPVWFDKGSGQLVQSNIAMAYKHVIIPAQNFIEETSVRITVQPGTLFYVLSVDANEAMSDYIPNMRNMYTIYVSLVLVRDYGPFRPGQQLDKWFRCIHRKGEKILDPNLPSLDHYTQDRLIVTSEEYKNYNLDDMFKVIEV